MSDTSHTIGGLIAVGAISLASAVISSKLHESIVQNQILDCAKFAQKNTAEVSSADFSSFHDRSAQKDLVFSNCVQEKFKLKF